MRKPLYYKLCSFLSALIVFHPISAIGNEITARDRTILYLAMMTCLREEGYMTKKEAGEGVHKLLKREGISNDRMLRIMEDTENIQEEIKKVINFFGGCKKIGEDYSYYLKK